MIDTFDRGGATVIDFRNLETFVWVARLMSFRLAAEKLNATQPAISARIALLERGLGVRLFDRRRRQVRLTSGGRELLGYAERMLALRTEMVEAVGTAASLQGFLRLGVPETILHTWLPQLIDRIAATYPSVTLDVEVDSSVNLREGLAADKLDIAFLEGPIVDKRFAAKPLCTFQLGWFASTTLKFPRSKVALADCAAWPIVTFRRGSRPYGEVRKLLNRVGLTKARMFGSSAITGTLRLALEGIGICVLPKAVVQRELQEGRLRMLPIRHDLPPVAFHFCYRRNADSKLAAIVADIAIDVARNQIDNVSKFSIGGIQKKN
jgi:DNA-binding transcriptional LysR family regulator